MAMKAPRVWSTLNFATILCLTVCLLSGCGGRKGGEDYHVVSGVVTLDGNPLPDATVIFTPKGGGQSAYGMTDSSGKYLMSYVSDLKGIPAGEYVVTISTYQSGEGGDGEDAPKAAPEKVPETYNRRSTLTAVVPGDSSTFQFELKSDAGKIPEPIDPSRGGGT